MFLSVVLVLGELVLYLFTVENALEEARTLLEQADRGCCTVEQELSDTNETLSDQACTNQAIEGARRKLEQEMQALNVSFLKGQHHEIISCF